MSVFFPLSLSIVFLSVLTHFHKKLLVLLLFELLTILLVFLLSVYFYSSPFIFFILFFFSIFMVTESVFGICLLISSSRHSSDSRSQLVVI